MGWRDEDLRYTEEEMQKARDEIERLHQVIRGTREQIIAERLNELPESVIMQEMLESGSIKKRGFGKKKRLEARINTNDIEKMETVWRQNEPMVEQVLSVITVLGIKKVTVSENGKLIIEAEIEEAKEALQPYADRCIKQLNISDKCAEIFV